MVAAARLCPRLAALGLHCCRRLTDAAMRAAAQHLRHLTSLNVSGCVPLSPRAVQACSCFSPALSFLVLGWSQFETVLVCLSE